MSERFNRLRSAMSVELEGFAYGLLEAVVAGRIASKIHKNGYFSLADLRWRMMTSTERIEQLLVVSKNGTICRRCKTIFAPGQECAALRQRQMRDLAPNRGESCGCELCDGLNKEQSHRQPAPDLADYDLRACL